MTVPGYRRRRRVPEDPCESKDARAKHGLGCLQPSKDLSANPWHKEIKMSVKDGRPLQAFLFQDKR